MSNQMMAPLYIELVGFMAWGRKKNMRMYVYVYACVCVVCVCVFIYICSLGSTLEVTCTLS